MLQNILRTKLNPKANATLFLSFLFLEFAQLKYNDNPIKKKRTFQTIGKTQFGGVIEGRTELYQELSTEEDVNKLPTKATA